MLNLKQHKIQKYAQSITTTHKVMDYYYYYYKQELCRRIQEMHELNIFMCIFWWRQHFAKTMLKHIWGRN